MAGFTGNNCRVISPIICRVVSRPVTPEINRYPRRDYFAISTRRGTPVWRRDLRFSVLSRVTQHDRDDAKVIYIYILIVNRAALSEGFR